MEKKKVLKYFSKAPEKKEDRVLRFIGSDEKIDRDKEVVKIDGWKLTEYRKNPIVLVNHNPYELPVARTKKVWIDKEKKALMFDIEFPPPEVSSIGDTLYKLYSNGFMSATSVGFRPNYDLMKFGDGIKQPRITFNEQELLEVSLVSIPSNPRALLTSKSMKDAIEQKVIDSIELDELKMWLDDILPDEEEDAVIEDDQDLDIKSEQTIENDEVHDHECSVCGDELVCVKCKGYTLDSNDGDYLEYFFKDFGESEEIDTESDDEGNQYVEELLNMLKTEN